MLSDGERVGQVRQVEYTAGVEHHRVETEAEGNRQGDAPGKTESTRQRGRSEEVQDRFTQLCRLHSGSKDVEGKHQGSLPETCTRRYRKKPFFFLFTIYESLILSLFEIIHTQTKRFWQKVVYNDNHVLHRL